MKQMTKLEKLCIKWLNDNYNHMEPFYMEKYPDYIFHMKDGKCILQYNIKSGYFYVSYREIWSFFERMFGMDNQQIKDITKIWVEEHYKMGMTKTFSGIFLENDVVEEHYKMGMTKTKYQKDWLFLKVEEHYQEIQTTNDPTHFYFEKDVEELYEQETDG